MENNIYLFDDHKGSKALVITKGDYTKGLTQVEICVKVNDPAFRPIASRLNRLLDSLTVDGLTVKAHKGGD